MVECVSGVIMGLLGSRPFRSKGQGWMLGSFRGILLIVLSAAGAVVAAADNLTVTNAAADPGATGVQVILTETNDQAMQGFSVAAIYDTGPLTCTGVSFTGTVVETASPGGPEYSQFLIDDVLGTVVGGVILDTDPMVPVVIPPTKDAANLLNLVFDVDPTAFPGDYAIQLVNDLGDPPVSNVFSSDGFSIFPELVDGLFTVDNPYRYFFNTVFVQPASTFSTFLRFEHAGDVQGFQVSVTYDNTVLTFMPQPFAGTLFCCQGDLCPLGYFLDTDLEEIIGLDGVEFMDVSLDSSLQPGVGWAAIGIIFDLCSPIEGQTLLPGSQSILKLNFQLSSALAPGECTTLDLVNGVGDPDPIDNFVIIQGLSFSPILEDGLVCVPEPGKDLFKRGDANDDGIVDLADPIFIINYLFVGGPEPHCLDAGDSNDDGNNLDVSDVIYTIQWMFSGGLPPPPPHPDCSPDPTSDGLECVSYLSC